MKESFPQFRRQSNKNLSLCGFNWKQIGQIFATDFYVDMVPKRNCCCGDRLATVKVEKNHKCPDFYRERFQARFQQWKSSKSVGKWLKRPKCFCIFFRKNGQVVNRSESKYNCCRNYVHGSVVIKLNSVPGQVLDILQPPIAVALWDPQPGLRFGYSPGLRVKLLDENGHRLAEQICFYEIGPDGKAPFFQHIIFNHYPKGVRQIAVNCWNSFLIKQTNSTFFCGGSIKFLSYNNV